MITMMITTTAVRIIDRRAVAYILVFEEYPARREGSTIPDSIGSLLSMI
jgi:hypothetical protein